MGGSAFPLKPRECGHNHDILGGLLGTFSSLCGPEEIERDLAGTDVEAVSFCFKQLFLRTGGAWTKLAISNNHRGPSRTIAERGIGSPFVEGSATSRPAADCLSSVVDPGRLQQNGQARTVVETGINATPKKPITIQFER